MTDITRRTFLSVTGAATLLPAATPVAATQDENGSSRIIVTFDPERGELPESIAFDRDGNAYVPFASGEIRRFSPRDLREGASGEPFATLDAFEPGDLLLGSTATPDGTLYTVHLSATFDFEHLTIPASEGTIVRVDADGTVDALVNLPLDTADRAFPNDHVYRETHGDLLVTESLHGAIWRITDDGDATIWVEDPLLEPDQDAPFFPLGANGIAVGSDGLYVANSTRASLIHIPVDAEGAAGSPRLVAQDERLFGADGIALDAHENIYVAVSAAESIARVTPDGAITVLADEGLAFPSALAFGTVPGQQCTVYITNFDAVEAFTDGDPDPSLATLDVGVQGHTV